MERVILASASPRRKELLSLVGVDFEILPSTGEEICEETEPSKMVEILALQKAEDVAKQLSGDFIVIGADTVVAKDGVIFEKHASEMLTCLQGQKHQVYSGVALVWAKNGTTYRKRFYVMTEVEVLPMSEQQILGYIASGDCMDKAGAYGIQGCFAEYICGISGDFYNVVGLPVSRLMQELRPMLAGG